MTSFESFAELCMKVEGIGSSLEKTAILASFFSELDEAELLVVPSFVMGSAFPASSEMLLGVGPSTLYEALSKATGSSLAKIKEILRRTGDVGAVAAEVVEKRKPATLSAFIEADGISILDVHARFLDLARASGKRSQGVKMKHLRYLFGEAGPLEARYIARLALDDMRIGVGEGIVRDAVAKAFGASPEEVERGYNFTGDLGLVAQRAKAGRLSELTIEIGRPIKMMLAQLGAGIPGSVVEMGTVAVEWKFDGSRVQIHKKGEEIEIFSRRLERVTRSLPEIVGFVKEHVRAESAILDGEAVARGEDGRPLPFQEILKRFRRKYKVERTAKKIPLELWLFDLVYLNGRVLIDEPLRERRRHLELVADKKILASQTVTSDPDEVAEIYEEAIGAGHEGVMLKSPESPYAPGKRGKNWLKIKPVMETLDLVVIGARWGEGRRASFLGSYRLASPDPDTGKLEDVGWVATGITDEMLVELTDLFRDLILVSGEGMEVEMKPEVVFEVAFEEIQKSRSYSSGYALRFPRLVRVRDDKALEEADDLERVASLYATQRGRSGISSG
ncbi:MAG: ATP-dependent DNA ligase [Methanothrix sp.]|uniref:DNA ligase n=1 Tax=Methanothrix harundinacea TaxID=301375 RepID=A0A101IKX4_9EURY|nr:MAG: DNA ligase [Methanothrix harundinacea]MCP1391432.1 ATP-dependent DNA ligase [Methanothrix harundinacea]MDD2638275.1 ATP-dependent DNA ligase [Methanothrix sp.]MDD3709023.1 ATP-dependent DNA ligase [Methanothrix sp.]MDI9398474.1 ATP-dependent DNA ligase [Euryarchaeota archaeon]